MSLIPRPRKPLKVLTLDGGGLQAISTLLILDRLLCTIQERNEASAKPRPCDVFDVIAGQGAGGWLALFLGRFQMDVQSCLSEWYNLTQQIAPRTKGEKFRRRLFHNSYFEPSCLKEHVNHIAEQLRVGSKLIDPNPPDVRCKYTFVAARREDQRERYNLFRTYTCPPGNGNLVPGPNDPESFELSSAFVVTGAARSFTSAQKERVAENGVTNFLDRLFPEPHNMTEPALDEIWALFGKDVPISVIVNIGPGMANDKDIRRIASRFSWGLDPKASCRPLSTPSESSSAGNSDPQRPIRRRYTNKPIDNKLEEMEAKLEESIRRRLEENYPDRDQRPPYYRLAPDQAPPGTVQNDARAPGVVREATKAFLDVSSTQVSLDNVGDRFYGDLPKKRTAVAH
ncbi:MAG: hypothetical protein MMC23_008577 [Stictis urceolatum]|nr:hypothetical protein [Stictis urceolata]